MPPREGAILIKIVAGSTVAWRLAARAQQFPVVGFLHSETPGTQMAAFEQGLKEGGYLVGQNVTIEYRWAQENIENFPRSRQSS